jgi:hypothetical protein
MTSLDVTLFTYRIEIRVFNNCINNPSVCGIAGVFHDPAYSKLYYSNAICNFRITGTNDMLSNRLQETIDL